MVTILVGMTFVYTLDACTAARTKIRERILGVKFSCQLDPLVSPISVSVTHLALREVQSVQVITSPAINR